MNEKYLIKNTTRQEREQIVRRSLGMSEYDDGGFSNDITGLGNAFDTYMPYINGEKEITEINASIKTGTIH